MIADNNDTNDNIHDDAMNFDEMNTNDKMDNTDENMTVDKPVLVSNKILEKKCQKFKWGVVGNQKKNERLSKRFLVFAWILL